MRRFTLLTMALFTAFAAQAQTVSTFEGLSLPKADTFYQNYTNPGRDVGFSDGLAYFPCVYDTSPFGDYWSTGFAYSNKTDSVTSGYANSYSAKPAKGYGSSNKYIVGNGTSGMPLFIHLKNAAQGKFARGFYITNTTYAYNSMRDGDGFAKKFGGATGNDADWFKVVIRAYYKGVLRADSVEAYLADFRSSNNANDYISKEWKWVNLMPLGSADSLRFELSSSDNSFGFMNTPGYFCIDNFTTQENTSPYPPQAMVAGTTAIDKTSAQIAGWGTNCTLKRGWMDIADKTQGLANLGDSIAAIGTADNSVVSLGDSGVAVVTFASKIYNGNGADFAVFENGFPQPGNPEQAFLELAFVEVSSDGLNFFRFPASCYIDSAQIPVAGVYSNARKLNNLAGKYISGYGTPFDLQELSGTPGLDIDNVSHVRLVDVVGSIGSHASLDMDGRKINDPYGTALPSAGFDLDAVAAMYLRSTTVAHINSKGNEMKVYPNPAAEVINITFDVQQTLPLTAMITDMTGKTLYNGTISAINNTIPVANLQQGVYFLLVSNANGDKWVEKITRL